MDTARMLRMQAIETLRSANKLDGGAVEIDLAKAWLAIADEMERPCAQRSRHSGYTPVLKGAGARCVVRVLVA